MAGRARVYLLRPETEWSLNGQHTGLTEIPSPKTGDEQCGFFKLPWAVETFGIGAH
jgi:hypothetical protein